MNYNLDTLKLSEKIKKISQSKNELDSLLKNTKNDINFNLNYIDESYCMHINFIEFAKSTNIYEKYKWDKIKLNYNFIKQKINKDKKNIKKIIQKLGLLSNYYTSVEIDIINVEINNINTQIDLMIYNFTILNRKHTDVYIKKNTIIKKSGVIIVHDIKYNIKDLLLQLYENYDKIKKNKIIIKKLRYKINLMSN